MRPLPNPEPVHPRAGHVRLRLIALLVTLWPLAAVAEQIREPNAFELAYTAIALDTDMHELCAKISPVAESRFLFNSPGTRIYRERSRCYLYVAVNSLNPHLCREVIEARAWFHDGSYFSRRNCEQLVAKGRPFNFTVSFDHALILKEMGYDEAEVRARFPRETDEPPWHRFYLDAMGPDGGEFQRRLRGLPDFGS